MSTLHFLCQPYTPYVNPTPLCQPYTPYVNPTPHTHSCTPPPPSVALRCVHPWEWSGALTRVNPTCSGWCCQPQLPTPVEAGRGGTDTQRL